jgi:hypothetical protein
MEDSKTFSRLDCFNPEKRAPFTHWIGGWVGVEAVERKIPAPVGNLTPVVLLVA